MQHLQRRGIPVGEVLRHLEVLNNWSLKFYDRLTHSAQGVLVSPSGFVGQTHGRVRRYRRSATGQTRWSGAKRPGTT